MLLSFDARWPVLKKIRYFLKISFEICIKIKGTPKFYVHLLWEALNKMKELAFLLPSNINKKKILRKTFKCAAF